jgi:hypothetical protein
LDVDREAVEEAVRYKLKRGKRRQAMTTDYNQHAEVFGMDNAYARDGQIAAGTLAAMVARAMTLLSQRYVNVRILLGCVSLDPAEIRKLAAREDFPKP